MSSQTKALQPVPPLPEQGPFTARYKRYGWEATVHYVYDKSGGIRVYVSDEYEAPSTLQALARSATKIHADFSVWISDVRLIQWANNNALFFRRYRQAQDNTLEAIV